MNPARLHEQFRSLDFDEWQTWADLHSRSGAQLSKTISDTIAEGFVRLDAPSTEIEEDELIDRMHETAGTVIELTARKFQKRLNTRDTEE